MTAIDTRRIEDAERILLHAEQVECSVVHSFGPGVYMREVFLPAGSFVVGHHHNHSHTNMMVKGRLTLANEDGTFSELQAPVRYMSGPGRKVAYVHEDTVWINVYATSETDIETLEAQLLTKSQTFLEFQEAKAKTDALRICVDREDFPEALASFGISVEAASVIAENESDMIGLPHGSYKIMVSDSPIHGRGLFATGGIHVGDVIAPVRISGNRTIAGRFTNHSANPNAVMAIRENGDIDLVSTAEIRGCYGGQNGDEITVNYRQVLSLALGENK